MRSRLCLQGNRQGVTFSFHSHGESKKLLKITIDSYCVQSRSRILSLWRKALLCPRTWTCTPTSTPRAVSHQTQSRPPKRSHCQYSTASRNSNVEEPSKLSPDGGVSQYQAQTYSAYSASPLTIPQSHPRAQDALTETETDKNPLHSLP